MKYLVLLVLGMTCVSSAWSIDIKSVVDKVEVRFNLEVAAVPEFDDNEQRDQSYQRSMQIAEAYMEQNSAPDALRKYIYAFRINPNYPAAPFMIGTILINAHAYEEAVAIFEELVKSDPDNAGVNNNLGWIYCTATDPKFRDGRKAEQYALKALFSGADTDSDYHVWSTLAEARYIYGNYEGALRAAKQSFMLARQMEEAELQGYKELLQKCERALEAEKALEEGSTVTK